MFVLNRLSAYGAIEKRGQAPVLWVYYNKDNDTVTQEGYLAHSMVSVGDQVLVVSNDGSRQTPYYVSSVANNKATLTAQEVA